MTRAAGDRDSPSHTGHGHGRAELQLQAVEFDSEGKLSESSAANLNASYYGSLKRETMI